MINRSQHDAVIYFDPEDNVWIAHSLYMDQIGTGQSVVDALADLIKAVQQVLDAAKRDPDANLFRRAPKEAFDQARKAQKLPDEVYHIAYRKVYKRWPEGLTVDYKPSKNPKAFVTDLNAAAAL